MKISIIQSNPKTADIEGNLENIKKAVLEADKDNPDLIILPRPSLLGTDGTYLLEYVKNPYEKIENAIRQLADLHTKADIVAAFYRYDDAPDCPYEATAFIRQGKFKIGQGDLVTPLDGHADIVCEVCGKKVLVTFNMRFCDNSEKADVVVMLDYCSYFKGVIEENIKEISDRAKEMNAIVVYANPCGANDSYILYGGSTVFSPKGQILAEAPAFEDVILTVDTEKAAPYNPEQREDIADMANALVMGIRDFFGKQGFSKAVIGLSGGIDSAVVAALTAKAIGGENVLGVLMPSEYTSQDSIDQALELAKNLGMPHRIVPIKNIFNTLRQEIGLSDEKTENGKVSLALQNLQSRSRGITIMALSNSEGRIAIATGNKSEIAVGYCTLYGDTVGSIAPIADLLKTEVYELAEYINRRKEIIPKGTITRPPSAELSPNQKDEDDLPPYSQLDKIVRMFVEEGKCLEEIKAAGIPEDVAVKTIRRIENNEFKRRQLPMGIKIARGNSFFYGWDWPLVKKNLY